MIYHHSWKASNVWLHPMCCWVLDQFQFLGHFWGPQAGQRNKYVFLCATKTYILGSSPKYVFLLLHTWVKKQLAINQCKRPKREQAAIEFKICISQGVLCTLNSRQNRCRNRHPSQFVWFFGNQTNSLLFLRCPLSSHVVNPKSNNPERIMWPSTHQVHHPWETPYDKAHFPSRQTTACKAELPRFHLIISNLSCKPS